MGGAGFSPYYGPGGKLLHRYNDTGHTRGDSRPGRNQPMIANKFLSFLALTGTVALPLAVAGCWQRGESPQETLRAAQI